MHLPTHGGDTPGAHYLIYPGINGKNILSPHSVMINQETNGQNRWQNLGTFPLYTRGTRVELSNLQPGVSGEGAVDIAYDAMAFTPEDPASCGG
ncbi:hypothetical protein [Actinophytocola sp.]|uniref:hypothetical protein n=1 Tax=Actinophytocola sp. TaxID=1872138 RepID=UPI003899A1C0